MIPLARILRISSVLTLLFCSSTFALAQSESKPTTVIFVRHAEKQDGPGADPPLSPDGQSRATNLAKMLSTAGIRAIYTSQYQRTKETARLTAEMAGLTPLEIRVEPDPNDRRKLSPAYVNAMLEEITKHAGETILVVGHTNTIGELIQAIGGGSISQIPESDYGNIFILTVVAKGKGHVTRLRY